MLARLGRAPLVFMYIYIVGIMGYTAGFRSIPGLYEYIRIVDGVYGVQSKTIVDSGVITSTCGKVPSAM